VQLPGEHAELVPTEPGGLGDGGGEVADGGDAPPPLQAESHRLVQAADGLDVAGNSGPAAVMAGLARTAPATAKASQPKGPWRARVPMRSPNRRLEAMVAALSSTNRCRTGVAAGHAASHSTRPAAAVNSHAAHTPAAACSRRWRQVSSSALTAWT